MLPIQWLLTPVLLFLIGLFIPRLKGQPLLRILVVCILTLGLVFLWFPDSSTLIANVLGIGRGVDLIIYLSLLGLTISCVLLYLQLTRLRQTLQQLIQQQALHQAQTFPQETDNSPQA